MNATLALFQLTLASASAGEGHGAEPTLFDGTIAQSIAALIVFSILFVVLYRSAWGPILKGLQDREEKIRKDLEHAEGASKQAAATLEEYRRQVQSGHDEARKVIEQGKADAHRLAAQIQEQTQAEINAMRTRAQAEIRQAKEQALNEIYAQTATLATEVASKILRKELNVADQRRLVEDSLAAASNRPN